MGSFLSRFTLAHKNNGFYTNADFTPPKSTLSKSLWAVQGTEAFWSARGGGGGYSKQNWVGLPKILTLFMTKICDFPYPIYDLK